MTARPTCCCRRRCGRRALPSSRRRSPTATVQELLAQLPYWLQAVAGGLRSGAMLFVDYGYARAEYYQPQQRREGTLRAFRSHHVGDDPYAHPGLQDLTASVDFHRAGRNRHRRRFRFAGYCSQARLPVGNGLMQRLAEAEERAKDETAIAPSR